MRQDPKFRFGEDDVITHWEDGKAIPADEPVMVLRGKDEVTPYAIAAYIAVMEQYPGSRLAREHAASARERLAYFLQWQEEHPERVGMGCHTCDHLTKRERLPDLPPIGDKSNV